MALGYCTFIQCSAMPSAPATPAAPQTAATAPDLLPDHLAQVVWRGDTMGAQQGPTWPSGHPALDAQLPGGGWPAQAMTEILHTQSAQAEWRLLSPVLAQLMAQGGSVLLIAPPYRPHLPGLCREGLREDRLILIEANTPAERLWATEQALKAPCLSAILSWLPQVRPEQVRRLQACAHQHLGPFFVFRPLHAHTEASAAPLRLKLGLGPSPHPLQVELLKRRGPALDEPIVLHRWPAGLMPLLPPQRPDPRPPQHPGQHPVQPSLPVTVRPPSRHRPCDLKHWIAPCAILRFISQVQALSSTAPPGAVFFCAW